MSLPKPYYQDSAVTLYHGDCRALIPLLGKFDLVLTDPPYGLAGSATNKNDYASFSDNADEVTALVCEVLEMCDVNGGG